MYVFNKDNLNTSRSYTIKVWSIVISVIVILITTIFLIYKLYPTNQDIQSLENSNAATTYSPTDSSSTFDSNFPIINASSDTWLELFAMPPVIQAPTWSYRNSSVSPGNDQANGNLIWYTLEAGSWARNGYTFTRGKGLNISSHGNVGDIFITNFYNDASKTNALWYYRPRIDISFNINGGSGTTPALIKKYCGKSINLASASGFSRSGYSLDGWSLSSTATSASYAASQKIGYYDWNLLMIKYNPAFGDWSSVSQVYRGYPNPTGITTYPSTSENTHSSMVVGSYLMSKKTILHFIRYLETKYLHNYIRQPISNHNRNNIKNSYL